MNVINGYYYFGAGGTTGHYVDFEIIAGTGYNTISSTVSCHSTYATPGGTINGFVTFSFSNCQLPAGNYFFGYNTNDTTLGTGAYPGIGGSCQAPSTAALYSGNMCTQYWTQTYGSYSGYSTTAAGAEGGNRPFYIQALPVTINSVGRRFSNFN